MKAAEEIVTLLRAHSGEPMDYVAIVMLLNTVAGGHYEERHSEEAIRGALLFLLEEGTIEAAVASGAGIPAQAAATGQTDCTFRLKNSAA